MGEEQGLSAEDERVIACPGCGGDGGWERLHTDEYPMPNGDCRRSWDSCVECDGTGEIIIVTTPAVPEEVPFWEWGEP